MPHSRQAGVRAECQVKEAAPLNQYLSSARLPVQRQVIGALIAERKARPEIAERKVPSERAADQNDLTDRTGALALDMPLAVHQPALMSALVKDADTIIVLVVTIVMARGHTAITA